MSCGSNKYFIRCNLDFLEHLYKGQYKFFVLASNPDFAPPSPTQTFPPNIKAVNYFPL